MEPHMLELPRRIALGNGVLAHALELCKELRLERPLVLADEGTRRIGGDFVFSQLTGIDATFEIVKGASLEEAERIAGLAGEAGAVIGVGGGSVIDVGKVVALRKGVDFICIPTAPSHDGIVSANASLTDRGRKITIQARTPLAIVADIQILKNAPARMVASGYADAVSNITAVHDWRLAKDKEYYSEAAAELALFAARKAMASSDLIRQRSERGIRDLIQALITSGISMALAGSSRPASGAEHAISHVLDMEGSKAMHGEQCGVASIVTAYMQGQDWTAIRDSLKAAGAPTNAQGLGIGKEMFISAIVKAKTHRERYTILNEIDADKEKAEEACRKTGVC